MSAGIHTHAHTHTYQNDRTYVIMQICVVLLILFNRGVQWSERVLQQMKRYDKNVKRPEEKERGEDRGEREGEDRGEREEGGERKEERGRGEKRRERRGEKREARKEKREERSER